MKNLFLFLCALLLVPLSGGNAYWAAYKEQFYRLYHVHYNQYPDDTIENIFYLEQALKANFANPLYALARIENEAQYEKYAYLFMMHLNLKMIEQYLYLANKYNKRNAYFYNAPWKEQNIRSLDQAEKCFNTALVYWTDALNWAQKARDRRFRFMRLERVEFWEDEAYRIIEAQTLNYGKTVERELALLGEVRRKFNEME